MSEIERKWMKTVIGTKLFKDSERGFEDVFMKSELSMMIIHPVTGNIRKVNPAAILQYGYSEKEFTQLKISDINQLPEKEVFLEMEKAKKQRRNYFQFRHKIFNGEVIDVEVHSYPIHWEQEKHLCSIVIDASFHKMETDKYLEELKLYEMIFNEANDGFFLVDLDWDGQIGHFLQVNEALSAMTLYEKEWLLEHHLSDLLVGDEAILREELSKLTQTGQTKPLSMHLRKKDGSIILIELRATPFHYQDQWMVLFVLRDITEREMLLEDNRIYQNIFIHNSEGVIITNEEMEIQWVNKHFETMTGYKSKEVIGLKPSILKSGIHDEAFYKAMKTSLETQGSWRGELWDKKRDGSIYPIYLSVFVSHQNRGLDKIFIGLQSDLSEKIEMENQLTHLVYRDYLTNLYNRFYFDTVLKKYQESGNTYALVYLDLDHFKNINDLYGHATGDEILVSISKALSSVYNSDLVCRLGGDEFAIITHTIDEWEISERARTFFKTIDEWNLNQKKLRIIISMGVALSENASSDSQMLLRNADLAMYEAKKSSIHSLVFFEDKHAIGHIRRLRLMEDLGHALERQELFLEYQPIVAVSDDKIKGYEALMRWRHSQFGLVPPSEFISIAEQTGGILELGEFLLDQSFKEYQRLSVHGTKDLYLSVNISIYQFLDSQFYDLLRHYLQLHQINPKKIVLEITESVYMENSQQIHQLFRKIRELGCRIAIDDFGAGYSSINKLADLQMDLLKIDRLFINHSSDNDKYKELIQLIDTIGKRFGAEVVVEGVETKEQIDFIRKFSPILVQGYYYAKPKTALRIIEGN